MGRETTEFVVIAVRTIGDRITYLRIKGPRSATEPRYYDLSRTEIVNRIMMRGQKFRTEVQTGNSMQSAEIHVVSGFWLGQYFLRTDANKIEADNLGNLPEF